MCPDHSTPGDQGITSIRAVNCDVARVNKLRHICTGAQVLKASASGAHFKIFPYCDIRLSQTINSDVIRNPSREGLGPIWLLSKTPFSTTQGLKLLTGIET